jgi:4-amino-4-deoxy-L-arabinose transferase-like glycosyltransferase
MGKKNRNETSPTSGENERVIASATEPLPSRGWRDALLLTTFAAVLTLPFVNKAFHVDDPLFIWTAKHILQDPLRFFDFPVNWDRSEQRMWQVMQNPPLVSYYLAPFGALFGWSEWVMHLAMFPFTVSAALGTYVLLKRFTRAPLLGTLLFMICPAFAVSATQTMSDVAMVSFWLWALNAWLYGLDTEKPWWFGISAVLIVVAALTKYFAVISLVPLLFVYTWLGDPKHRRYTVYLLIPIAAMLLYEFITLRLYGKGLLTDAESFARMYRTSSKVTSLRKTVNAITFTGACLAPVLLYFSRLWSRRVLLGWLALGIVLFGIQLALRHYDQQHAPIKPGLCALRPVFQLNFENPGKKLYDDEHPIFPTAFHLAQWSVWFVLGLQGVALPVLYLRRKRDRNALLLFLWIFGTLAFTAYINHHVNARVILPIGPAVMILLLERLREQGDVLMRQETRLSREHLARLGLGFVFVMLISYADYSLADSARAAARDICAEPRRGQLFFSGHSGFQYYMEEGGGKSIDWIRDVAVTGDRYVLPSNNWTAIAIGPHLVGSYHVREFPVVPFLSTSNPVAFAGFYSDFAGPMPFSFGPVPPEQYLVVELRGQYERRKVEGFEIPRTH